MPITTLLPPPNIATNHTDWIAWRDNRYTEIKINCPIIRALTYYFSMSGDDVTGNGSENSPFKTIAKAKSLTAANVRLRFKRGDVWEEQVGLDITDDDVTVDAYGTGELPLFNRFTVKYSAGWVLSSGTMYVRAEVGSLAWIRDASDRLGEARGTHFIRALSSAECATINNSWYWDGSDIYLNLGGEDPNTLSLEAVFSNLNDGVGLAGDGCRCENIRADGWGCSNETFSSQKQPFTNRSANLDVNCFINCEGYFSGSHVMAHYLSGNSGGVVLFQNCKAGFAKFNGDAGEIIFNTYSSSGGQETWFSGCETTYGTLKSTEQSGIPDGYWAGTESAPLSYTDEPNRGESFFGHAVSTAVGLIVAERCLVKASHTPARGLGMFVPNAPGIIEDLVDARVFSVNCEVEVRASRGRGVFPARDGSVVYGCKLHFHPSGNSFLTLDGGTSGKFWLINSLVSVDLEALLDTYTFGLVFGFADANQPRIWNSQIRFFNCPDWSADRSGINQPGRNDSGAPGSGDCPNGNMVNSIFSTDSTSLVGQFVGLTNVANTGLVKGLGSNAYYGVNKAVGEDRGYDNDPGLIDLVVEPEELLVPILGDSFYQKGIAANLELDFYGTPRSQSNPSIGPIEKKSPIPPAPTGFAANAAGTDQITLTWSDV